MAWSREALGARAAGRGAPKAVFLDRDGVLNEAPPPGAYIRSPAELRILPGTAEALARLRQAGFRLVVVTNQRGIALGRLTTRDVHRIHVRLQEALGQAGAAIDLFLFCPHDVGAGCPCRKPRPGMLLQASARLGLHLPSSFLVGDSPADVEAGRRAGCRTVYVGRGGGEADFTCRNLPEAVDMILGRARSGSGGETKTWQSG